jgi:hypothetical protein
MTEIPVERGPAMGVMDKLKSMFGKAKDSAGDAAEKAKDVAGDVADKVKDVAHDIKDKIDGDDDDGGDSDAEGEEGADSAG